MEGGDDDRGRDRDRVKERGRDRGKERHRGRGKERDRDRGKERHRKRDRDRNRGHQTCMASNLSNFQLSQQAISFCCLLLVAGVERIAAYCIHNNIYNLQ